jgi:hypothetical protein
LKRLNEDFQKLLQAAQITQNEKDYILSQYSPVTELNRFNVPLLNMMLERITQRYENYYKKNLQLEDVPVSDLNYLILASEVARLFKVEYLSESEVPSKPVVYSGIRFGQNSRILFSIPTTFKSKTINVFYLLDTESPLNNISTQVKEAFKIESAYAAGTFRFSSAVSKPNVSRPSKIPG